MKINFWEVRPINYWNDRTTAYKMIGIIFTLFFLNLQNNSRLLLITLPLTVNWTPYSCNLRISREIGLCQSSSHQANGRSGVYAHCWGWLRQLSGPANLFQTWPQPIWFAKPPLSKLLWKLLKNEKFEGGEETDTPVNGIS